MNTVATVPSSSTAPVRTTVDEDDPTPVLTIDLAGPSTLIDPRLFGTNVPAWLGPDRLTSEWFLDAIERSGVTTIRMPGGSWSNSYSWSHCELIQEDGCLSLEAVRPIEYAQLLTATGLEGVWTVSVNETAEGAAALVAYFNADVDDERPLGVDRNGVDWGLVGDWAKVRAFNGHPEPVGIELWEFGNEIYGARAEAAGEGCFEAGWEDAWTCDGRDYVIGDDEHDGYLAVRSAMLEVDPNIEVGAVGVPDPTAWSGWGEAVLSTARDDIDFYVLHVYGFERSPSTDDAIGRAPVRVPDLIGRARDSMATDIPIAVTEYNLVSGESRDTELTMPSAANALFTAGMLGEMARAEVPIANHWNMANGTTNSGTDYGLVDADTGEPFPVFTAFEVWKNAGPELMAVEARGEVSGVSLYPTRRSDGSVHAIIVNARSQTEVFLESTGELGTPTEVRAWTIGGTDGRDLVESEATATVVDDRVRITMEPASLIEIEFEPDG